MAGSLEIEKAAQELVARYGSQAIPFIKNWAGNLAREGMVREETVALLVLNAAERLLMSAKPAAASISKISALPRGASGGVARPNEGGC